MLILFCLGGVSENKMTHYTYSRVSIRGGSLGSGRGGNLGAGRGGSVGSGRRGSLGAGRGASRAASQLPSS